MFEWLADLVAKYIMPIIASIMAFFGMNSQKGGAEAEEFQDGSDSPKADARRAVAADGLEDH